ncbi:MAG: hypothetical protein A2174_00015 [Candidatus Portnoybacteria bacterium RBG_13_41_18]|uniref:PHP domain-containing protein n=1 Tax=Candidatus Portnoybacteria bacterium RBG_13_41_18 TaxID=1801991 RepID=A0A1G2FBM2_9BACT|nr:MAG: hypothetical protein A2174_00015 [Candidatus Portnoybacteria bacterium RBG_13_41_18]
MEISLTHFDNQRTLKGERLERLEKMIEIVKKNNFKILLGSDAHVVSEVAVDNVFCQNMERLGLSDDDIANNDISYLRKFIKNI